MSRAHRRGRELRRNLGLRGQVDVDAVANILGLEVVSWPFEKLDEMMLGDVIGVSPRLDSRWRRWVVAHAMGHGLLHPGNHLWKRLHTGGWRITTSGRPRTSRGGCCWIWMRR